MKFEVEPAGEVSGTLQPHSRITADALLAVVLVCASATVLGRIANRGLPVTDAFSGDSPLSWLTDSCSAVLFGVSGWYLATRRPGVSFGWLALLAGLGHGLSGIGMEWVVASELGDRSLPAVGLALWFVAWGSLVELPVLAAIFCLYPDGRLPRGAARVLSVAAIAIATVGVIVSALNPDPLPAVDRSLVYLRNGFSLPVFADLAAAVPAFFGPALLLACGALVLRWRAADGDRRRVLSWMVLVAAPTVVVVPVAIVTLPDSIGVTIAQASTLLVMATLVTASLRHHVFGIDLVLNRTLVYVALTAIVAGVYGSAVAVGSLIGASASSASSSSFIAALVAALVLIPARVRVQAGVDHLLYGDRDEPYRVVSQVSRRVGAADSADQLLPSFVESAAAALRVPYVGVEFVGADGARSVSHGSPPAVVDRVALEHQGAQLGSLVIGRRPGQHHVDDAERQLLEDLARQATAAASYVNLTEGLRRSRERIVVTREEERRRLRRDLHDGLGPQLTGVALGLDVLAVELQPIDHSTSITADALRDQVHEAIRDIRRLVHDLRPPRLDEVGLIGAIREVADQVGRGQLQIVVDSDAIPPLPAAVEVAMFRIANEALTNVVRHAQASSCTVQVRIGSDLSLVVVDDGRGLGPADPNGLGLTSMRERAEELGGWCTVDDNFPRGCRVAASVPLVTT